MNTANYERGMNHAIRNEVDPALMSDTDYANGVREGRACAELRRMGHVPNAGYLAAVKQLEAVRARDGH